MKILNERPPIWDKAVATFPFDPSQTVFTFGDTLYNPSGKNVPDHVIAHEMIHSIQQQPDEEAVQICDKDCLSMQETRQECTCGKEKGNTDAITQAAHEWWDEYLGNSVFRLTEEVEAYAGQYAFYCDNNKDRNHRARFLHALSRALSGGMYGPICTHAKGVQMIKAKAGV